MNKKKGRRRFFAGFVGACEFADWRGGLSRKMEVKEWIEEIRRTIR